MTIRYHQRRDTLVPHYRCANDNIQRNGPVCLHLPGHAIDRAIEELLLQTVTPLALEVALTVQAELEARAGEADQLRRSHVDRARQNAELARRRYLAVDPDNRLVADTLEADWNDTLRMLQAAQDEYDRQTAAAHAQLTDARKAQIRELASDFPKLWSDPATPARERNRVVRLLIEDVTLNKTDQIHLHVRFRGGQTSSFTIPIPLDAWKARKTDPDTFAMLDRLLDDHTDGETAEQLNAAGRRSGTNKPFTAHIVLQIRDAHHVPSHQQRLRARGLLTIQEAAQRLGVHASTIKRWHAAGLLTSPKANDRNEHLFDPPDPNDPRLRVRQGWRLHDRKPTEPSRRGVSPGDTGISQARAKTDKLDARTLAKLLWTGELEAVWMPPEWISRMRGRLARREQLVRARSRVKSPQIKRLMTVPAVNVICATIFLAAVGDIRRFKGSRPVVPYLGLDPRVYQSGSAPARGGRISKQGSPRARWALVEAARSAAQQPGPMHAFYERIRARKGHNAAVVAVARKLAVLFWCMLTREEDYAHQQPSLTAQKLRRLEVKAGDPTRPGKPTGVWATRERMRHAEKQLAAQAEASYKRSIADWRATSPNNKSADASVTAERA